MKLKPFIEDASDTNAIDEVLTLTGLKRGKTAKLELDEIRDIFEMEGAGIKDVAKMAGSLIRAADKEETKLRAGELALKVQGVFKEMDGNNIPQIIINVEGEGNNTLLNLVCPA